MQTSVGRGEYHRRHFSCRRATRQEVNVIPRCLAYFATATLLIAATTACEAQPPGGIAFAPTAAVSPVPIQLVPQAPPLVPLAGSFCPLSSPFTTTFTLVIGAAPTNLVFQRLTLQPIDGRGVTGLSTVLTGTQIAGSATAFVSAGATRAFLVQPQFGCGVSMPQFFVAEIELLDSFGSLHHTTLKAPFR
jgi:hypothetical protein